MGTLSNGATILFNVFFLWWQQWKSRVNPRLRECVCVCDTPRFRLGWGARETPSRQTTVILHWSTGNNHENKLNPADYYTHEHASRKNPVYYHQNRALITQKSSNYTQPAHDTHMHMNSLLNSRIFSPLIACRRLERL